MSRQISYEVKIIVTDHYEGDDNPLTLKEITREIMMHDLGMGLTTQLVSIRIKGDD